MDFYFIYAIGVGNKCYLDRDGNLCYDPDLMGEVTARSIYSKALKEFSSDVELCLCLDTGRGDPIPLERRCGEVDEED